MKWFFSGFLLLFIFGTSSAVQAYISPAVVYCQRHGYAVLEEGTEASCIFPDGTKCNVWPFLTGQCGAQYRRPLPCVQKDQPVFTQFEICCRGLTPAWPSYGAEAIVCVDPASFKPKR